MNEDQILWLIAIGAWFGRHSTSQPKRLRVPGKSDIYLSSLTPPPGYSHAFTMEYKTIYVRLGSSEVDFVEGGYVVAQVKQSFTYGYDAKHGKTYYLSVSGDDVHSSSFPGGKISVYD